MTLAAITQSLHELAEQIRGLSDAELVTLAMSAGDQTSRGGPTPTANGATERSGGYDNPRREPSRRAEAQKSPASTSVSPKGPRAARTPRPRLLPSEVRDRILAFLRAAGPTMRMRDIAAGTNQTMGPVRREVESMLLEGLITMQGEGEARRYVASRRPP